MKQTATILSGDRLAAWSELDRALAEWSCWRGAEEHIFPVLIGARTLQRAGYDRAFPHLLLAPCAAVDPAEPLTAANAELLETRLSPAVCYHAYASLEGRTLSAGVAVAARGACFRREEPGTLAPGRRQIEFQMREHILIGPPDWLEEQLSTCPEEVQDLAETFGLEGHWQPASDPFFLPAAQGQAHLQRLLGTKSELCLADGLAVASINRHGDFFGQRFNIRTADGAFAHSACIAFGLDRWIAHARTPLAPAFTK